MYRNFLLLWKKLSLSVGVRNPFYLQGKYDIINIMKETFPNWTAYDDWIVAHYKEFDVYQLDEIDGQVVAEYCTKEEYPKLFPKEDD